MFCSRCSWESSNGNRKRGRCKRRNESHLEVRCFQWVRIRRMKPPMNILHTKNSKMTVFGINRRGWATGSYLMAFKKLRNKNEVNADVLKQKMKTVRV